MTKAEKAEAVGTEMLNQAWAWLSEGHSDAEPTTYRKVVAAVQCLLLAAPDDDLEMAAAAIGAAFASLLADNPYGPELAAAFDHGVAGYEEARVLFRGTMQ